MPNPTHTPDAYLFTNEWGDKELLLSLYGEPAQRLLELGWTYSELFARTVDTELLEALKDARTTISITRTNVLTEIGRCADPSESRWAGVPEQLAKRLASIDAAITKATGHG